MPLDHARRPAQNLVGYNSKKDKFGPETYYSWDFVLPKMKTSYNSKQIQAEHRGKALLQFVKHVVRNAVVANTNIIVDPNKPEHTIHMPNLGGVTPRP